MSNPQTGTDAFLVGNPGLGRITATGPDATAFLEAQSMSALAAVGDHRLQRCAFADAKGRVVATALAWHAGGEWRLILPAGEADWFVSHLLRFRFRSKVEIAASTDWRLAALYGDGIETALQAAGLESPPPGTATTADGVEIASPAPGRCLVAAENDRMAPLLDRLGATCGSADKTHWDAMNMQAGEAVVAEATRGRFLPQFLDLDRQEVVAWNKGCYPGQEVIARLQHRGTVKYRLLLLGEDLDAGPGERTEAAGVTVEIVGHGVLPDGRAVTQVVAPWPFDPALESHAL